MGFDIDLQSAGIGYGAGILTGYAIYQSRHVLGAIRNSFSSQVDSAQSLASMGGDRRYVNELTKHAMQSHLFGKHVDLSDILIEPRFIPDRELTLTLEDDEVRRDPFEVVPIIPDFPYLHQPYNMKTVGLPELGFGDRAIALLGLPGSGRTTALLSIALWSMAKIEFSTTDDPVEQRIADEQAELSREERDERAKTQIAIEQRAKEQLREELGVDITDVKQNAFVSPFRQMAPIYVDLANVRLGRGDIDPAEPLIRAVQYQTGNITSKTVPRKIYRFLDDGVCLLLLDGLDHLPPSEQRQKTAWLHALLDEYSQNFVIVTGHARGYGMLQQAGFTPVHLRPWSHQDNKSYVKKLSNNWGDIVGQRRVSIDDEQQETVTQELWGLNPFETTMKVHSRLQDGEYDDEVDDYGKWVGNYLRKQFDDADDAMPMMANAAYLQLEHHFFKLNDWVEVEINEENYTPAPTAQVEEDEETEVDEFDSDEETLHDPRATFADEFEQELDDPFGSFEDDADEDFAMFESADHEDNDALSDDESDENEEETSKDETKEARQIRRSVNKLLSTMIKAGLVERYQGRRYRFKSSYICSYLASLKLQQATEATLVEKANQSNWLQAIAFTSMNRDIQPVVEAKMSAPTDIIYSNILDVVYWLRYSEDLAEWRNRYLNYLGQMFVAPSQYKAGRERIAAALATTRDPVVRKIFGRGVQHDNVDVRRLSLLALGIFQEDDMLDNLSAYLSDASEDVQVASTLAIGNIHTEDADTLLSQELFSTSSERVQQCIAEIFADKPDVGYEVLWELLNDDEYKAQLRIKRAAVLGVKRINTSWALEEIYRTYLNEEQWYVKSTAQAAFAEKQSQRSKGIQAYPQITTLVWLRDWSIEQEDEALAEASGIELLNLAMRQPQSKLRELATTTSGQLGVYENIPDIYRLLNDQEDTIRDVAYRALGDLQLRMGKPLPLAN
jgi:HEAT repeat protein